MKDNFIYIVYLNDKPSNLNEKAFFDNFTSAENYMNNAIRMIGKRLYHASKPKDCTSWYDIGEEAKQPYFEKAKTMLSIKTFKEVS